MSWSLLLAGLLSLGAAVSAARQDTQPTAEAKLVKDLYGKRIAEAMASVGLQDNIELARELMTAAAESGNPPRVRQLLAVEAVKLTACLGTSDGAATARQALRMADQLGALDPVRKHRLALEIAKQRYSSVRQSGTSGKPLVPLAADVVEAEIALVNVLLDRHELGEAESVLGGARSMASVYKLDEHKDELEAATARAQAVRQRFLRLRAAEGALARARRADDPAGIEAAKKQLALIYLFLDGDLAEAGRWIVGAGHPDEAAVIAAAAYLKDNKTVPPADQCNGVVEKLCNLAQQADNAEARARIASTATAICRAFLATGPKGLRATKARLLLTRAERLAGESPADRFVRLLKAAYGGLAAKIEVLPAGSVRVSYDFSSDSQFGDWSAGEGRWKVVGSKQILLAGPQRHSRARISTRLHFRADKPLSLRYLASGRQHLVGVLHFLAYNNPAQRARELRFELGSYGNQGSALSEDGRRAWHSPKLRVLRNATYRVQAAWDGQGTVTWTVNGKLLCRHQSRYNAARLPYTAIYVSLEAWDQPAGFDDVIIEGAVIEHPSQRLEPPRGRP